MNFSNVQIIIRLLKNIDFYLQFLHYLDQIKLEHQLYLLNYYLDHFIYFHN